MGGPGAGLWESVARKIVCFAGESSSVKRALVFGGHVDRDLDNAMSVNGLLFRAFGTGRFEANLLINSGHVRFREDLKADATFATVTGNTSNHRAPTLMTCCPFRICFETWKGERR
jgi:hypothetical protein